MKTKNNDIDEFLANGGRITELKPGESAFEENRKRAIKKDPKFAWRSINDEYARNQEVIRARARAKKGVSDGYVWDQ